MSEGELKKRIANEIARTDMDVMNVLRIVDEARKDLLLKAKTTLETHEGIEAHLWYDDNLPAWKKKWVSLDDVLAWFGEVEK